MTSFFRKVMTGLALLVVGGLVIGGTMALASDQASTGAVVSSSSDSQTPSIGGSVDDDGTADQGPGDVPVNGDQVSDDDDGTPDQGPGDFPFGRRRRRRRHDDHRVPRGRRSTARGRRQLGSEREQRPG